MSRSIWKYYGMILLVIFAIIGSFFLPRRELRSIGQVAGVALDREAKRQAVIQLIDLEIIPLVNPLRFILAGDLILDGHQRIGEKSPPAVAHLHPVGSITKLLNRRHVATAG